MSATTTAGTTFEPPAAPPPAAPRAITWHGVRTVAQQEMRLRLRTGRWRWVLVVWVAVLLAFCVLLRLALGAMAPSEAAFGYGPPLFGGMLLFALSLALLIVPALTAQSVNGDRERGTLATLQATLLTPAEIAIGKLLAAWGTALVFLALTLPFVAWSVLEGGMGWARVVVTLGLVALLLGAVCAVSQMWSAVFARSLTSAMVSYLTVFALAVGTPVVFGLSLALTTEERTVTQSVPVWANEGNAVPEFVSRCDTQTFTERSPRPDRVWPILAPNPFVILADAAPRLPTRFDPRTGERVVHPLDPLGGLGQVTREARLRPALSQQGTCVPGQTVEQYERSFARQDDGSRTGKPVWPTGLVLMALLLVGSVFVTIRRLRTPQRHLPRGVRVA